MCAFVIAAAPAIARLVQRPRVWWLAAIGNSGAMTLYLWHILPLLAMHLVFDYLAILGSTEPPGFIALSIVELLIIGGLVAVVFVTLRLLENNPVPDGMAASSDAGSAAARRWVRCCALPER